MIFDFRCADLGYSLGSETVWAQEWTVKELKDKIMASQMAVHRPMDGGPTSSENHDQPRAATKYLKEAAENPSAVKMRQPCYFFLRGTPSCTRGRSWEWRILNGVPWMHLTIYPA